MGGSLSHMRSSMTHDRHANSGASCWEGHTPGPPSTATAASLRSPPATQAPCFGSPGTPGPSTRSTQYTLTAISNKSTGMHHASTPVHALFDTAPHSAATSKAQQPCQRKIVDCRSSQGKKAPSPPCSLSGQISECGPAKHLALPLADPQTSAPKTASKKRSGLAAAVSPRHQQSRSPCPSVRHQGVLETPASRSDTSLKPKRQSPSACSGTLAGNGRPDSIKELPAPARVTEPSQPSVPASPCPADGPAPSGAQALVAEPGQSRPHPLSVGRQQGGAPCAQASAGAGQPKHSESKSIKTVVGEVPTNGARAAALTESPCKPCVTNSESAKVHGSATCGRRSRGATVPAKPQREAPQSKQPPGAALAPGLVLPASQCLNLPSHAPASPQPQGNLKDLGCEGPGGSEGLVYQVYQVQQSPTPEKSKLGPIPGPLPISPLYTGPLPPSSMRVPSVLAQAQRTSPSAHLLEDLVSPLVSKLPGSLPCLPALPAASSRCPPLFQKPAGESPGSLRGSAGPPLSDGAASTRLGTENVGVLGPEQRIGDVQTVTPVTILADLLVTVST